MSSSSSQRPAFVDSKGCRWDANHPEYEGWLTKKSRWLMQWRKRYFILKGSKMFFARDATSAPHGMINIVDCVKVESLDEKTTWKRFSLRIVLRDEEFHLFAESEEMMNHWIRLVKKYVVEYTCSISSGTRHDISITIYLSISDLLKGTPQLHRVKSTMKSPSEVHSTPVRKRSSDTRTLLGR